MQTIDDDHMLIDLSSCREVEGAQSVDEAGDALVLRKDAGGERRQQTVHLGANGWRIVRRGR
jgi:hypothetical protein